ncbi:MULTISPECIES: tetratricopeptide repeat protein [unclassified Frankia]|uniref:tetratricopeptide repeat protein n=1 Tax=unclassified Frankia TaxID=2632575 RepID=UPI001934A8DB|nr:MULTISPECIES: tetratricopeptide repeat protein [unclassified Frankia]MBL7622852.1 sel1 repeat family protein [Frankia sp. AgB1.8]
MRRLRKKGHSRRAVRRLRRAAEAGHAGAAFELSVVLRGRGQEQEGLAWCLRAAEIAAEQGQPATEVASYLRLAGEYERAEDVLRQAAETGDGDAAYFLGKVLQHDPTRLADAERFYLMACELGHVEAPMSLSLMLTRVGRLEEGERYYRLAAERGDRMAARRLGNAAWKAGRDQDAERYLRIAAQAGRSRENDDVLALADFLGERGRIHEALPILHELGDHIAWRIGPILRRAGLAEEAQLYDNRANEWEKMLDALDDLD